MRPGLRFACVLGAAVGFTGCQCQPTIPNNNKQDPPTNQDSGATTGDTGSVAKPCAVPETEPNNSVTEANELPLEQMGCGVVSQPGDLDVFVTEVEEEGWLAVTTIARPLGSVSDIQFILEPPEGSAAYRLDDEGTTDASLLFPGTPGRWEIQITDQNFSGGDDYFYNVIVSSAKAPVQWTASEVEPNDALATAMPVMSGDVIFGDMEDNLDGDWYRIDVPVGKHTLLATVTAYAEGSAGDFVVYLSDAQQNLLPMGCNPAGNCATRGHPVDPALHDPILEWESEGNETLYVKVNEEDFRWGRQAWYIIAFELVST